MKDSSNLNPQDVNMQSNLFSAIKAMTRSQDKSVYSLLDRLSDITFVDSDGNTLLHAAIESGLKHLAFMILDKDKTLLNKKNFAGETPLHYAVLCKNAELVKFLLDQEGIEANAIRSHAGASKTVIDLAARIGDSATLAVLLSHPKIDKKLNVEGCTALHVAAQFGFKEIMQQLIDAGYDIHAKDDSGKTVLHTVYEYRRPVNQDLVDFILTKMDFASDSEKTAYDEAVQKSVFIVNWRGQKLVSEIERERGINAYSQYVSGVNRGCEVVAGSVGMAAGVAEVVEEEERRHVAAVVRSKSATGELYK